MMENLMRLLMLRHVLLCVPMVRLEEITIGVVEISSHAVEMTCYPVHLFPIIQLSDVFDVEAEDIQSISAQLPLIQLYLEPKEL